MAFKTVTFEDVKCSHPVGFGKCDWPKCTCPEKVRNTVKKKAAALEKKRSAKKSALTGKIKTFTLEGKVTFEMGGVADPLKQKTLYAHLVPDDGEWALILRPEGHHDSLLLTTLHDGSIMLKVVRR